MKSWKGILLALLILASFAGAAGRQPPPRKIPLPSRRARRLKPPPRRNPPKPSSLRPSRCPTFTFGGVEFYPILLSEETLTSLDTTEGTLRANAPKPSRRSKPRSLPPTATASCSLSPTPRRGRRCWITTTPTCRRWWRHCTPSASWNPRPA